LSEQIADEEDAGAEAVLLRREAQVLVHLQRREADVHAVERAQQHQQDARRNQADSYASLDGFPDRV
jgi:hypothetical protein